ncbi:MAG: insulinase family protein [Planctomycetes bacterium]|nr:insulinase family protein [Planctomycetota bacterium]
MKPRPAPAAVAIALAAGIAASSVAIALAAASSAAEDPAGRDAVVPHPRDLVFPELRFEPPDRAKHRHELPSGPVVYVVEDHELPLVDVTVHVRGGSYLEPSGKAGLAALTGSQIRSGGTARWSPEDFDEELAFLAATMSSSIGDTEGSASFNCLSKDLPRVLDLFSDMLWSPRFDPQRLELKLSQDLQDLARRNDQTSAIEAREWERLLRGSGFFTTDRVTKATLGTISREDLAGFHRRLFHPRNFVIAVAGDVDARGILDALEGSLKDWAREDWPGGPIPPVPKPAAVPAPGLHVVDKAGDAGGKAAVNQGRVSIGHRAATRDHPDFHALTVMNHILGGGGFTSRITSRVRSDEGLAYSAGSRLELGVHFDGTFRAFFQSKSETVGRAARIVLEEIERMRKESVSGEELETAVNHVIGSFPRLFATPQLVTSAFASDELTGRDAAFWRTYREKVRKVTAGDVLRVAREHLKPEALVVLVVGDAAAIEKGGLRDAVEGKVPGAGKVRRIPLPDPLTLEYPGGD